MRNVRNINGLLFYITFMNRLQYVGDYTHNEGKNKIAVLKRDKLIHISIHDKKNKIGNFELESVSSVFSIGPSLSR